MLTTHQEVKQAKDTCFRITPADWNNVPKIVYEAMTTLIERFDLSQQQYYKSMKDHTRDFSSLRMQAQRTDKQVDELTANFKMAFEMMKTDMKDRLGLIDSEIEHKNGKIHRRADEIHDQLFKVRDQVTQHSINLKQHDGILVKINRVVEDDFNELQLKLYNF